MTRVSRRTRNGFTLVELLTVIGLIILIVAMAVPNFSSMMRERRWASAMASIQNAILRVKTYCVTDRYDHAIEFCQDTDNIYYMRLEAECAFLENIPQLQDHLNMVGSQTKVPEGWWLAFRARRNAWGEDGRRLYSGITDFLWGNGWGHLEPANQWSGAAVYPGRFFYDDRYPVSKAGDLDLINDFSTRLSSAEKTSNSAPYLDVQEDNIYYQSNAYRYYLTVRDNLAIDDFIYLPFDIRLDLDDPTTNIINFDDRAAFFHGWDNTKDLRFDKLGFLIQSDTPEILLRRETRTTPEFMRLRLLRGSGRLQKLEGNTAQ